MPKKFDPAVKERALRMYAAQRSSYPSRAAACEAVASISSSGVLVMQRT